MVVIGSMAASYHIAGITPNDLDLCGTYEEAEAFRKNFKAVSFYPINSGRSIFMRNAKGEICEIEIAWPDSRAEKFLDFIDSQRGKGVICDDHRNWYVPSLDILYLLKMSHRYLKDSPHFLKTMRDIQMMRNMGCTIRPEHQDFYEERMKDTYTYAHPKLNVNKKEFFDEESTGVVYTYDHDDIHKVVAVGDRPAYTYFIRDDSEVLCSREKFEALPLEFKLRAGLEESYVLAIERSLVPFPGVLTPKEAFDIALMKVATSITSGWFREFVWESYDAIQAIYSDDYVVKFQQGLENGLVKPFDKSKAAY